jgi:hypothetical protein
MTTKTIGYNHSLPRGDMVHLTIHLAQPLAADRVEVEAA